MGLGHSANCIFSSWWVQKLSWVGVSAWSILFDSRFDSKYFVTSYSREGRGFPFLIKSKSIWRFRKVLKQVDCWGFKHRQCISWLKIETQTIHIIVVSREEDILLPLVIHPWSSKLIHGYLWVVTGICQSCCLDLFKFFFSASQLLFTPGAQCLFSPPAVRGKTKDTRRKSKNLNTFNWPLSIVLHKHRKNWECCPGHYLIVNSSSH